MYPTVILPWENQVKTLIICGNTNSVVTTVYGKAESVASLFFMLLILMHKNMHFCICKYLPDFNIFKVFIVL